MYEKLTKNTILLDGDQSGTSNPGASHTVGIAGLYLYT
jgi:hypothetical protein